MVRTSKGRSDARCSTTASAHETSHEPNDRPRYTGSTTPNQCIPEPMLAASRIATPSPTVLPSCSMTTVSRSCWTKGISKIHPRKEPAGSGCNPSDSSERRHNAASVAMSSRDAGRRVYPPGRALLANGLLPRRGFLGGGLLRSRLLLSTGLGVVGGALLRG